HHASGPHVADPKQPDGYAGPFRCRHRYGEHCWGIRPKFLYQFDVLLTQSIPCRSFRPAGTILRVGIDCPAIICRWGHLPYRNCPTVFATPPWLATPNALRRRATLACCRGTIRHSLGTLAHCRLVHYLLIGPGGRGAGGIP